MRYTFLFRFDATFIRECNIEFGIVAEGSRKERLERDGIGINGQVYHPKVWTPDEAKGVDLLIVALKYGALDGALDSIDTIAGKNTSGTTTVMSLMNGVDSEEIISTRTGMKPILHSLIKVASHKEDDGYHFDPETTIGIVFGELVLPLRSNFCTLITSLIKPQAKISTKISLFFSCNGFHKTCALPILL